VLRSAIACNVSARLLTYDLTEIYIKCPRAQSKQAGKGAGQPTSEPTTEGIETGTDSDDDSLEAYGLSEGEDEGARACMAPGACSTRST
jgi:hypothetical protein